MTRTQQTNFGRADALKPRRTLDQIDGEVNAQIDAQIDSRRWQAVLDRDPSLDGVFVFAVSSTGVFCRPSCPAKRPHRKNVRFFGDPLQAEQSGYRACLRCRPKAVDGNPRSQLIRAICRYIERHIADQQLEDRLTLRHLAREFRRSSFHLQRTFKSVLGVSPKAYIDAVRLRSVKQNLQAGHDVTTALYAAGYGSSSRLYERTAAQLGMTPEKYRRGAVAAVVRYTIADSPLGRMLIAATDKGICSIQFAERSPDNSAGNDNDRNDADTKRSDEQLQQGLMREFPFATRRRDDGALQPWKNTLARVIRGQEPNSSLPLDIRATAFQRRVWEALQEIPRGETRSYSAVAEKIGMPKATRAIARACATNPVAVVIPCHRVVRQDGNRGGYRWGIDRKDQLLALERQRP
ncbi:MAG TPA: bifunctional DNA-binding transcriptional regulator/O6-methylguanine-DNA methyltransferase Ada [Terriglobales bacterium]|nr:bifunctional DNA-binding transcriptional regulator/O6-methylguanine-DNA methyltransferase Ada [Terriglobales bacterium]